MTRDEIAAGPHWEAQDLVSANDIATPHALNCMACRELAYVDIKTGLCRPCFRVWRFVNYPAKMEPK